MCKKAVRTRDEDNVWTECFSKFYLSEHEYFKTVAPRGIIRYKTSGERTVWGNFNIISTNQKAPPNLCIHAYLRHINPTVRCEM